MGYIGNQSARIIYTNIDRFKGEVTDIAALNAITGMVSGDMYKLISTNHAYIYNGSVWVDMGDIEGPQGPKGTGISSIVRTAGDGSEGTTDTYTITYDDTSTSTFNVTNGTAGTINHIAKTDTVGTTDTYTAYADAAKTQPLGSFDVYNGVDGRAITTVTFTSTTDASGLPAQAGGTDTYTISYSDDTTSTYDIYNGMDVTNVSVIDDDSTTTTNAWSASKISSEFANVQASLNFDSTPTEGSTNPVTSDGVFDGLAAKQDTLVSGTNIKTINGSSVLGSGNITISTDLTSLGVTATATELNYVDGVTSAIQTQLNAKQVTLVSGTNIKTINGNSILGAGNVTVTDLTKLSLSGGVMTGAITAIRETKVAMSANNIDLATGNLFTKSLTANTTFTVSNILVSGNANSFILELTNAGAYTITWFSGVKWAGGTAPTLTASGVDILGFYSHDGGATWRGMVLAKDSK